MNITDITGIQEATAQRMASHGIDSVEAVAHASIGQLVAVPGIGARRAAALRAAANRLLAQATADADESGAADSEQPGATTGTEDSDASAEITGDPGEADPGEADMPPGEVTRDGKGKEDGKKRKAEKKPKKRKKGKKGKKRKKETKKEKKKKAKRRKKTDGERKKSKKGRK